MIDKANESIVKDYGFTFYDQERFIQALFAVGLVAAKVARRQNLIQFDHHRVIEHSLDYVKNMRDRIEESQSDAFDIIGNFVTGMVGETIIERTNSSTGVAMTVQPLPRSEIAARFEIEHDKGNSFLSGKLFLSRSRFAHWCYEHGTEASGVMSDLKSAGVNVAQTRLSLSRRTPVVTTAIWAYEIDLKHPQFASLLNHTENQNQQSKLQVVN